MRLKAEHISYKYPGGSREVLSDVSLELGSTDRLGIAAPSGFGKTTLCQILAGCRTPVTGRVCVDDMPLPGSGYCPVQMIWQHPEQAVNPRVRMQAVLQEGDSISERVIEGLGIERDWCNRYPGELSGGELQRFSSVRCGVRSLRRLCASSGPPRRLPVWMYSCRSHLSRIRIITAVRKSTRTASLTSRADVIRWSRR